MRKAGYVYLFYLEQQDLLKIGSTGNVRRRQNELARAFSTSIICLGKIESENALALEHLMHREFFRFKACAYYVERQKRRVDGVRYRRSSECYQPVEEIKAAFTSLDAVAAAISNHERPQNL